MKSKRQKAQDVFVHKENGQQYQSEGFYVDSTKNRKPKQNSKRTKSSNKGKGHTTGSTSKKGKAVPKADKNNKSATKRKVTSAPNKNSKRKRT